MPGVGNMLVWCVWLDMFWMEVMAAGDAGCWADSSWEGRCHSGLASPPASLPPRAQNKQMNRRNSKGRRVEKNRRRDGAGRRMKNEWKTTEPISPSNKHSSWISFSDRQRWRAGEKKIRGHQKKKKRKLLKKKLHNWPINIAKLAKKIARNVKRIP